MIVMKFGGSSVANAERIAAVSNIIKNNLQEQPIVVSSALGKTTDLLLEAGNQAINGTVNHQKIVDHHHQVCSDLALDNKIVSPLLAELEKLLANLGETKNLNPKAKDYLVSFGERLAIRVLASYLSTQNVPAKAYDSWDLGLKTNSCFGQAEILESSYSAVNKKITTLTKGYQHTPIVSGFIAKDITDSITTFGRGGSDLTASFLGAAIKAKEIQVWKDVSGLMTADPKKTPTAIPVNSVTFDEAAELAYFGAKVLHPLSMRPAKLASVPVRIKNSYQPEDQGTLITEASDFSEGLIKSITIKENNHVLDIVSSRALGAVGFLARVFNLFEKHNIIIDVLASSEVSISPTIHDQELPDELLNELNEFAHVQLYSNQEIVSVVCDISNSAKILEQIFHQLAEHNLNPKMMSQGASKVNISFVFGENQAEKAVKVIHEALINLRNNTQ